jgi:hypothetical protein
VQVKEQLASATLGQISGGPPLSPAVMPMQGTANLCVLFPGCGFVIPIPLTVNGTRGIGIGGSGITGKTLLGNYTITLQGTVWTIGLASIVTATGTVPAQGFVHGPASNTSSTAKPNGVIQLVTPSVIYSTLAPGNPIPVMSTLRLRFTPEPGGLLLLGTGLAFLVTVARRRPRG